jgi:hypothetical protein|tara:strand:+ start:222 stop:749 length:528 start_codon:yes stop_codon:yes gene_type:complete
MARSGRRLSKLLTNSGSGDMTVDGSSTAVEFTLSAPSRVTYYVDMLVLTIHSTSMDLSRPTDHRVFGAAGLLPNGLKVTETHGSPIVDVEIFPSPVLRLADFFRYSTWSGAGIQMSGHAGAIAAGTDLLSVTISWPDPLLVRANGEDKLTVTVQDDLSGLVLAEAHAVGTQSRMT